jgi:hypothetical protein
MAVQTIYYPGFTLGGLGEPLAIVATLVMILMTPRTASAFWWTLIAFGGSCGEVSDLQVRWIAESFVPVASVLSETVSEFGGALGIALLGSSSTFLYRHGLISTMPANVVGTLQTPCFVESEPRASPLLGTNPVSASALSILHQTKNGRKLREGSQAGWRRLVFVT